MASAKEQSPPAATPAAAAASASALASAAAAAASAASIGAHLRRSAEMLSRGDKDAALSSAFAATAEAPDSIEAWMAFGLALYAACAFDEASAAFETGAGAAGTPEDRDDADAKRRELTRLARASRRLHNSGAAAWRCAACGQFYRSEGGLQRHRASMRRYVFDAVSAQRHASRMHGGLRFPCSREGCEKHFTSASGARAHKLSAHDGLRFFCERQGCDEYFTSASNARQHACAEHDGLRVPW